MENNGKEIILGSTVHANHSSIFNIEDANRKKNQLVVASSETKLDNKQLVIDYSWLPMCSDTYDISPNIEDYVFCAVPILSLGIPNRNLQAFTFPEVTNWDVNQGKATYKTFIGKPTYTNHKNNTIPHLAKGVHFDAYLEKVPKYNIWKVIVLLGFDRKKDAGLCDAIVSNTGVTGYSMGAMVEKFLDSTTGKYIGLRDADYNKHRGTVDKNGMLRYVNCCGVTFFETSCLGDFGRGDPGEPPADHSATSDIIWG